MNKIAVAQELVKLAKQLVSVDSDFKEKKKAIFGDLAKLYSTAKRKGVVDPVKKKQVVDAISQLEKESKGDKDKEWWIERMKWHIERKIQDEVNKQRAEERYHANPPESHLEGHGSDEHWVYNK